MVSDRVVELEARLSRQEQLLRTACFQFEQSLTDARSRRRRSRTLAGTTIVLAAIAWMRAPAPLAQGTPQTLTVKAPFLVVDDGGRKILEVSTENGVQGLLVRSPDGKVVVQASSTESGGGMVLARGGKAVAGLAVDPDGAGRLKLTGSEGRIIATISDQAAQINRTLVVADRQEQPVMEVRAAADGARGILIRESDRSVAAQISSMPGGGGAVMARSGGSSGVVSMLRAYPDGSPGLRMLSSSGTLAEIKKTGLTLNDSQGHPVLLAGDKSDQNDRGMSVFADGGKAGVSLSADNKGGIVRVLNASGGAVGGLLARESGGGLALTGPSGGNSAVSLSVESTGGTLRVFPQGGGPAQVEVGSGAGGGAVTVYANGGSPAALVHAAGSGAGRLELSRAGQILVEAGVLPSGLGVVRTGPGTRPGNAVGLPGTYIMGAKRK